MISIPYLYNKILIIAPCLKISELIFGARFMFLGSFYFIKRNLGHTLSDFFKMLKQKYYYISWVWGIFFIFMMTQIYLPKIGLCFIKKLKCNFDHGRGFSRFQKPLFWYHWTYSCPLVPNLEGGHLF